MDLVNESPRVLGNRYEVGDLLGRGGMAEVHLGRDTRLGRDVAIKMLRTDLARDPTFQERFRREAQNAAALNHPAIVAVYDTGEEISDAGEKLPFIVMEFVNGLTLKEVLAAEQRLQPRRALGILADICAALEFSHRHGIIHRDIKPGNVMMTPNGQVKVMDFGIARALASGATTMTQTSAVIGTAQYLSPEQARGESVDARSDVYAAGCVRDRAQGAGQEPAEPLPERPGDARRRAARRLRAPGHGHAGDERGRDDGDGRSAAPAALGDHDDPAHL